MEYPTLTYLQKAVIVSLYYNTGDVKAIKNSNFIKYLVDNDIEKSIDSFQKWNKVKVKIKGKKRYIVSNGLVNRRNYEAKLIDGSFNMADYNNLKKEMQTIYLNSKS
jgi:GH24 family phage-related lysozyme (muramidase)